MESKHITIVIGIAIIAFFTMVGHSCSEKEKTDRIAIEHGLQECQKVGTVDGTIWSKECK